MPPTSRTAPTYFSGRVHSIRHDDPAKAFYILRVSLDAESLSPTAPDTSSIITVRGEIPGVKIAVGVWFGFEGVWDNHSKYGHQVKVTRAPVLKNGWDDDTCEKVLLSQGIGSTLAAKVRETFKGNLLSALSDPEELRKVPGVTTFIAEHIALKWKIARSQLDRKSVV